MPGQGPSLAQGAMQGASTGSLISPGVGSLVGAGIGAIGSAVESNQRKKAAERAEARPERRRLTAALDIFKERRRKKERTLATLSQAVADWARTFR